MLLNVTQTNQCIIQGQCISNHNKIGLMIFPYLLSSDMLIQLRQWHSLKYLTTYFSTYSQAFLLLAVVTKPVRKEKITAPSVHNALVPILPQTECGIPIYGKLGMICIFFTVMAPNSHNPTCEKLYCSFDTVDHPCENSVVKGHLFHFRHPIVPCINAIES